MARAPKQFDYQLPPKQQEYQANNTQSGSSISHWAGEAGMSRCGALQTKGTAAVGGCCGRTEDVEDREKGMKLI